MGQIRLCYIAKNRYRLRSVVKPCHFTEIASVVTLPFAFRFYYMQSQCSTQTSHYYPKIVKANQMLTFAVVVYVTLSSSTDKK